MPFDHVLGSSTSTSSTSGPQGGGHLSLRRLEGAGVPSLKHMVKSSVHKAPVENQENSTPNTARNVSKE
jgi:hypothetical protein